MNGIRVPPGRAGRLHLDRRLAAARSATDLLDRKLRILTAELAGLQQAATRTEREWNTLAAAADQRLLVAALLGGQRATRLAMPHGLAGVELRYATTIGIRHPSGGSYAAPRGPDPWAGLAVDEARQAVREALAAAVNHAAAARAAQLIDAEVAATRIRLRAIRDRLIPRLEEARAKLVLAIDEQERGDAIRLRLAAARPDAG
ncbi:MAG TPA: V-type ATP synthase subunit D [Streptosporangiaceae bacterium]|nr:V-type ATP synthase subunit D [Streptosporangiaceae bacterium]